MNALRYWLVLAAGILLAAFLFPGIEYTDLGSLLLVVLILSLLNMVLKPLLILFTLPFIVLSLGLGIWLINAFLLYVSSQLVPGFYVAGFGSALLGSLVISLTHFLASRLFDRDGHTKNQRRKKHRRDDKDVVIDV